MNQLNEFLYRNIPRINEYTGPIRRAFRITRSRELQIAGLFGSHVLARKLSDRIRQNGRVVWKGMCAIFDLMDRIDPVTKSHERLKNYGAFLSFMYFNQMDREAVRGMARLIHRDAEVMEIMTYCKTCGTKMATRCVTQPCDRRISSYVYQIGQELKPEQIGSVGIGSVGIGSVGIRSVP